MAEIDFIAKWYDDILRRSSLSLPNSVRVEGLRRQHLGPRLEYAQLEVLAEPSASFEVIFGPDVDQSDEKRLFLEAAVLGMIDVLLIAEPYPLRNVRITIVGYQFDPINSSQMAFRHAGRDVGRRIMASRKPSSAL